MDNHSSHKRIVDSATFLYRFEIPGLIEILKRVRNFGKNSEDQILISANPILLIWSIVSILNNQAGAGTFIVNRMNYYTQKLKFLIEGKQFQEFSSRNVEAADDQEICYNLAFTIHKLKLLGLDWCNSYLLIEIVCKLIIDHQIFTSLNVSEDQNLNVAREEVEKYYRHYSYAIIADEIIDSQSIISYIINYGSKDDISYYKEMQLKGMEQEFILNVLHMYHLRGNDYTFYNTDSFKEFAYNNLLGG
jgi:hypothetical protein